MERISDSALACLEVDASCAWKERQEDCAKHGAKIPMPTMEVPVDTLASMANELRAYRTPTGLDRAAVRDLTYRLAQFFDTAARAGWDGAGLDGGDIQDLAVKLGLFVIEPFDPEKHHGDTAELDPGDDWYTLAADVKNIIALGVVASPEGNSAVASSTKARLVADLQDRLNARILTLAAERGETAEDVMRDALALMEIADASCAKEQTVPEPEGLSCVLAAHSASIGPPMTVSTALLDRLRGLRANANASLFNPSPKRLAEILRAGVAATPPVAKTADTFDEDAAFIHALLTNSEALIAAAEAGAWRPIAELEPSDAQVLAAREGDGAMMVWPAKMLWDTIHTKTPNHLQFKPSHFRTIAPPTAEAKS